MEETQRSLPPVECSPTQQVASLILERAMSRWQEFRRLMPIAENWAYFDHAAVAPLSGPARQAIHAWTNQAAEAGDSAWSGWASRIETVRRIVAQVIAANPTEVALVPNTTSGINLVAEGFPWQSGDNIVTLANEFPSNLYPWMQLADRGVETRRVPVDVAVDMNRIADACDERTRIVSVSWVGYATGWRVDIDQLVRVAHDHSALLFLDAIQGLGVFPLDVQRTPIDFLAADGHKWLLGPEGAGIFYIRNEHLDLLRPLGLGWNSVVHAHDFANIDLNLRPEAARYEGGSQNMVGFHGLGASLELLVEFGLSSASSAIADRIHEIGDYACQRLAEIGARIVSERQDLCWSGIVAFDMPGRDLDVLRAECLRHNIALSCRDGFLRIAPHAYVNKDDVERLISVLAR